MKAAFAVALLLCAVCGMGAEITTVRPQKLSILGKDYVRIDEWARANSYHWKWLSKHEAFVWNNSSRMQFTTDSARMSLNGITVLLSEVVRSQNGVPLIAAIDLTTAIQPVLFPPRNKPRMTVKHICLDAGHGGRDPGNREGREQEKKYTLLLAQELGAQLRQAGYTISFTRTSDTFIDLPVRPDIARRRGADLFISLHFNSAPRTSSEIGGVEVFCMTPQRASSTNARGEGGSTGGFVGNINNAKNMALAYQLEKAIVHNSNLDDRGVKRARFAVLRGAEMPAVLIESGFMSNPAEARKIYSATWRKQLAQSIVTGIESYRKIVEP